MLKILFTEFAELKQGDGKGPKFYAGKAYWLAPDQAERWKTEGIAEDAPEDMPAENEHERGPAPLRPENVRIVRRKGKFHVVGPDDLKFHEDPLSAHDAEKLRQRILAGDPTVAVVPETLPEPQPLDGPTVTEWVEAGYKASAYPPSGYVSKSTQEEIDAAVAAEVDEDKFTAPEAPKSNPT